MTIRLVFLGRLEDLAGPERTLEQAPATLDGLLALLEPELAAALAEPRIRIAVNGDLVSHLTGVRLADGDEVAFLPPVSGG